MTSLVVSLPIHILCQLIASSGSNNTICDAAANQSSVQIESVILPDGYVAHPDLGVALKVHDQLVSWMVARKQCELDGGNLAVIDSRTKFDYVLRQRKSTGRTHVGIIRIYDDEAWVSVPNASPVLSIPWASGEPSGVWDCVMIYDQHDGLCNSPCTTLGDYACEIAIFKNDIQRNDSVANQLFIN